MKAKLIVAILLLLSFISAHAMTIKNNASNVIYVFVTSAWETSCKGFFGSHGIEVKKGGNISVNPECLKKAYELLVYNHDFKEQSCFTPQDRRKGIDISGHTYRVVDGPSQSTPLACKKE